VLCDIVFVAIFKGRLLSEADTLFWYNISSGKDFLYYKDRTYVPQFSVTVTADQEQQAARYCTTSDGIVDAPCQYDYFRTGSAFVANATLASSTHYSITQDLLCMYQHLRG